MCALRQLLLPWGLSEERGRSGVWSSDWATIDTSADKPSLERALHDLRDCWRRECMQKWLGSRRIDA
eukprot:5457243-Alexandrium_andersonii.AAC.1